MQKLFIAVWRPAILSVSPISQGRGIVSRSQSVTVCPHSFALPEGGCTCAVRVICGVWWRYPRQTLSLSLTLILSSSKSSIRPLCLPCSFIYKLSMRDDDSNACCLSCSNTIAFFAFLLPNHPAGLIPFASRYSWPQYGRIYHGTIFAAIRTKLPCFTTMPWDEPGNSVWKLLEEYRHLRLRVPIESRDFENVDCRPNNQCCFDPWVLSSSPQVLSQDPQPTCI